MVQLSRPYQVALAAVAALALVWMVALRGHSSSSSQPSSGGAQPQSARPANGGSSQSSPSGQSSPGASSHVYHGAAPGVEGLTRDIAKAHGAAVASERNAAETQRAAAQASGEGQAKGATSASASASAPRSLPGSHAKPAPQAIQRHSKAGASQHASSPSGRAPQQIQVEREIERGKTVLLLFWEPRSAVDNAVRSQVFALGKSSKGRVSVHVALAEQVGLFGPVTEVAHVYQTPTILIVNRHGLVTTLTGLVDKFSLQQTVREAQRANR